MNRFIAFIIGLSALILIVGIVLVSPKEQNPQEQIQKTLQETALVENDQVKGNEDAQVTIIEYSDFQCPACAAYLSALKQALEDFPNELQIVYRHYPIRETHSHAELAAHASEAAGNQGKFWEYHDMLFDFQSVWSEERNAKDKFIEYAQTLELDVEKFKSDLDSEAVKDKVTRDYQSGLRLGVNSTPSFFLNGIKLQNPKDYDEFKNLIQSAIDQS